MKENILSLLKASEVGAIMAYHKIGSEDKNKVDAEAVKAINYILQNSDFPGVVAIGEGSLDQAPMLYAGQKFSKNIIYDIAVDPVEGTRPVAFNNPGAITSFAIANKNSIAQLPEMYMEKLFVSPYLKSVMNLKKGLEWNLKQFKKKYDNQELKAIILNKPRHDKAIKLMKKMNIHVSLINDGDVLGAMDIVNGEADFLYGIGGSPEGALMASLAIASNCKLDWKLVQFNKIITSKSNDKKLFFEEQIMLKKTRFKYDQVYSCYDLVSDKSTLFVSTAITSGTTFQAVNYKNNKYKVASMMVHEGIVRNINSIYNLDKIRKYDEQLKFLKI